MILRPVAAPPSGLSDAELAVQLKNSFLTAEGARGGCEPAWAAIARTQNANSDRYLLVTQPDHARLAGELAAHFRAAFLPEVDTSLAESIGIHDDGWRQFPEERDYSAAPKFTPDGRPSSFLDIRITGSLSAWRGSIEAAAAVSLLGEYVVSGHFFRLGDGRLRSQADTGQEQVELQRFVAEEDARLRRLEPELRSYVGKHQPSDYVDLLQFCDTLSLYLCCGTTEAAEFPQRFGAQKVRIQRWREDYVTEPPLFGSPVSFYLTARSFPGNELTDIEIRIK